MSVEDHAERVLELVALIPPGRVLAYGDVANRLGGLGPRTVGTVLSRYGSGVPWWRVCRADGRPAQGLEPEALELWRSEGTPLVGGPVTGTRADMASARWLQTEGGSGAGPLAPGSRGGLHHVEIWVAEVEAAKREWGWLLERLGYRVGDDWGHGRAWELGSLYLVVEAGPDVVPGGHDRTRAGINHLAFHAGSRKEVDAVVAARAEGGWSLLFPERHPYAGGPAHYAAYLVNGEGFEVELVAD